MVRLRLEGAHDGLNSTPLASTLERPVQRATAISTLPPRADRQLSASSGRHSRLKERLLTGLGEVAVNVCLWVSPDLGVLDAFVPEYLLSRSCSNLSFKSHNDTRTD